MKRISNVSSLIISAIVFCLFFVFLEWKGKTFSPSSPSSLPSAVETIKPPPTGSFLTKANQKSKAAVTSSVVSNGETTQGQNELSPAANFDNDQAAEATKFSSMELSTLRKFLNDPDPSIAAEAQKEINRRESEEMLNDLLGIASDESQTDRHKAFQIFLSNSDLNKETLNAALRGALDDPDISFVATAVQFLAAKSDSEALNTLKEAYESSSESSRRLLIVESLASNSSAIPMLNQAREKEDDERVKKAIDAILAKSE